MVDKTGTGEELGVIDIGKLGEIAVFDDGDPDQYCKLEVRAGGGKVERTTHFTFPEVDRPEDDAEIIEILESIDGPESGESMSGEDGFTKLVPDGPFVCDGCERTWPSSKRTNSNGEKLCPECE